MTMTVALTMALAACQPQNTKPTSAQIESVAMAASQQGAAGAERQLRDWAAQGWPVAQRELGMLYRPRPARRADALQLLEQAARAGDTEAAFELGELERTAVAGVTPDPAAAWPWYRMAAEKKHARAALMLALLARNGEGVARDDAVAAHWLTVAAELGEAHAMFLLSNAYHDGQGVPRDAGQARQLLEAAAEHDYPPAIQELAMTVQTGDALSPKDELRASHLMKEANEHRHNSWNTF
ncbi:tetratricopeptide repeat protein [Rugamonas sp.]|uniref:tetratricopeptide repeat protein n=1 Tax=Rugamonas sp. TaxID=1926287 RepID=UPI0025D3BEEF|nr:tetratricopeptide repeat protein [Rugamonas sp.]